MDLSNIKTNTREVEVVFDGGLKTGLFLTLRYESSKQVQKVTKAFRSKLMAEQSKGKRGNKDAIFEQYEHDRLLAHVADWRWDERKPEANWRGERPEFSTAILEDMLSAGEFGVLLKSFINDEIGVASDFLSTSNTA